MSCCTGPGRSISFFISCFACGLLVTACGDDASPDASFADAATGDAFGSDTASDAPLSPDAGADGAAPDAGGAVDAGGADAGNMDAGDRSDAGPPPPTYYVDTANDAASDENPGTEEEPWATLQHAGDTLAPGERVFIKAGTYAPFNINVSGAEGSPIVFAAFPGDEHEVIIDGEGGGGRGLIELRSVDYITIEGLRIINGVRDGIYVEGSAGELHGHHVIRNCEVDTVGNSAIYVCGLVMGQTIPVDDYRTIDILIEDCDVTNTNTPSGVNEAITVGGGVDGVIVRNNVIHDSDQYGIDFKLGVRNGVIEGNHIYNMEKHGIYIDAACRTVEDIVISNNRIHDCMGNGITIAREATRGPMEGYEQQIRRIDVFNNIVYRSRRGVLIYQHIRDTLVNDFDDVRIFNNTLFDNVSENARFVDLDSVVERFVFANNIVFQSGGRAVVNEFRDMTEANNSEADPGFVSGGANPDFHLTEGSSAIGAGSAEFAPAFDFDGVARGTPPDLGALEFVP